jgi:hypothetical protein
LSLSCGGFDGQSRAAYLERFKTGLHWPAIAVELSARSVQVNVFGGAFA